jgi:multidrug resistance efflux pump
MNKGDRNVEVEMNKIRKLNIVLLTIIAILISGCDTIFPAEEDGLTASGVIEVVEVAVSPEIGGRVSEVFADQGDFVQRGEVMYRLDEDTLLTQRNVALAAIELAQAQQNTATTSLESAHAAITAAEAGVEVANLQYELALDQARNLDEQARIQSWNQDNPKEFSLPVWYFLKEEEIRAAESEFERSKAAYEIESANYESIRDQASQADLTGAEERLANAQAAFIIVEQLLDRKIQRDGKEEIEDYLEIIHDDAEAELEAAQSAYETLLSEQSSSDVLEARGRLVIARERYETALDRLNGLLTGSHSKTVKAAEAGIILAEAAVIQAHANLSQAESSIAYGEQAVAQAQAGLDIIDLQIAKLDVPTAVSGTVMIRNIEPGEIIQPGVVAFIIGQLDQLTIKVYVPENVYGLINLGDAASVSVDSYPGETFSAKVIRIADQAEYTPRNVQTQEERQTTVFEIELSVDDSSGKLKPGMPADVRFE